MARICNYEWVRTAWSLHSDVLFAKLELRSIIFTILNLPAFFSALSGTTQIFLPSAHAHQLLKIVAGTVAS